MEKSQNEKDIKNEKDIALIKQDINYIKTDLKELKSSFDTTSLKLDAVLRDYPRREEFVAKITEVNRQIDGRIKGVHDRIKELCDTKLDIKEYKDYLERHEKENKPYSELFWKSIGWVAQLVITGGLLAYFLNK